VVGFKLVAAHGLKVGTDATFSMKPNPGPINAGNQASSQCIYML